MRYTANDLTSHIHGSVTDTHLVKEKITFPLLHLSMVIKQIRLQLQIVLIGRKTWRYGLLQILKTHMEISGPVAEPSAFSDGLKTCCIYHWNMENIQFSRFIDKKSWYQGKSGYNQTGKNLDISNSDEDFQLLLKILGTLAG